MKRQWLILIIMFFFPTAIFSQCTSLYGIHWWTNDANTNLMNSKKGWTVEIINTVDGPNAINGLISSIMSEGVFTPIVRINRNWGETVPGNPADYDQFAEDCKNIISNLYNNYGVKWFQIGNEMNLDAEYPPAGGCPASEYVACFNKVYTAVKANVPNANVLVGPVGPWNPQGSLIPGGGSVYYDVYFDYIVNGIGNQCDGYGMHTYGFFNEGTDNNLSIYSLNTFANGWGFNAYQVQIKILQQYNFTQNKSIQITETNTFSHNSAPATSYTNGWMQQAFQEINNWNTGNPNYLISSLCWFVNKDDGNWASFALQSNTGNMPQARSDFSWTTANTNYTVSACVPANLQVTPDCSGNVNFNWDNSGSGWFIDVSTDAAFASYSNKSISNITATVSPSGFSPAFTFVPNTTYYWRIWNGSVHTDGNSFTISECPANLQAIADCSGNVNFNWTNFGNGWFVDVSTDQNFSIFSNKDVSGLTSIIAPAGFSPSFTFSPNTTYYWRIWNGTSHTNGNSFTISTCPTNLQVFIGCAADVAFNWTNSGSNWALDVSTDPNFSFYYNISVSNQTTVNAPLGFACDIGFAPCTPNSLSFQPNTIYYWRIWNGAVHSYGNSFTVPAPLAPPTITPNGTTTFCQGGSVTLDAGLGYSTYSWSTGATTQTINVSSSDNYSVTITDGNGCLASSSVTPVTVNPLPSAPTITPNGATTFCQGGSVILDAGTGYTTYSWSTGATTQTINVTSSDNYSVTITDGNGCSAGSSVIAVTVYPLPAAPVITPNGTTTFCQGGSVTLDAGAGYTTYLWSTGATTQTINVSSSDYYSVTITDGNGCLASSSVTPVTVNPLPSAPTITPNGATTFCQGGSVTIDAGTGYNTYSWSTGATTQTINVTSSDNYSVTITDVNGCSASSSVIAVSVNLLPSAPTITPNGATTFCQGGSVTLDAGTGYSTYLWSNGATTQTINVTGSDNYSGTITDGNGCSSSSSVTVVTVNPLPSAPVITPNGATTFCQGGSVILDAGTGYTTYLWSNGATTQTINVTSSDNYSVTITDGNGCSVSSSLIAVTVNPLPAIPTIIQNGNLLTSSAVTGNQWYLNNNSITGASSQNYTAIQAGNYTVTITDMNSCSATSAAFNFTTTGIEFLTMPAALPSPITVYPNPNNGTFTLRSNMENTSFKIIIMNLLGEQIQFEKITVNSNELTIKLFKNEPGNNSGGIYFMQMTGEGIGYKTKILVK